MDRVDIIVGLIAHEGERTQAVHVEVFNFGPGVN